MGSSKNCTTATEVSTYFYNYTKCKHIDLRATINLTVDFIDMLNSTPEYSVAIS